MECSACHRINYHTFRNKKKVKTRLGFRNIVMVQEARDA